MQRRVETLKRKCRRRFLPLPSPTKRNERWGAPNLEIASHVESPGKGLDTRPIDFDSIQFQIQSLIVSSFVCVILFLLFFFGSEGAHQVPRKGLKKKRYSRRRGRIQTRWVTTRNSLQTGWGCINSPKKKRAIWRGIRRLPTKLN
jgi:hypothetical protein